MTIYKRHLVGYSDDVKSVKQIIDGIKFFRTEFPAGSTSTYRYERDTPHNLRAGIYVQTEGAERTDGTHTFAAGWVSRFETEKVVPAGNYVLTSITDCVLWCCLGLNENEPTDYMTVESYESGQTVSLLQNDNLLVILGEVQGLGQGHHIRVASSGGATVTATSAAMVFRWNSNALLAQYAP